MWGTIVPVGDSAADMRQAVGLLEAAVQMLRENARENHGELDVQQDADALFGEALRLGYEAVTLARAGLRRHSGSRQVSPSKGISMEFQPVLPVPPMAHNAGNNAVGSPRTPRRRPVSWTPSREHQRIEIAFSKVVYSVTVTHASKAARLPPCCAPTGEKVILNGMRAACLNCACRSLVPIEGSNQWKLAASIRVAGQYVLDCI
jgi:hypothetical protein